MWLDFIFTSWLLWPFALGTFVVFSALTENSHSGFATLLLTVILGGLQLFTSYQPISFIVAEPAKALWFIGGYIIIGFIYMFVKWAFVAHRASIFHKENQKQSYYYNGNLKAIPFVVKQWKSEILTWFAYWPFSAAWTLLNDPIRLILEEVYAWSSKRLQSISDSFFK